MGYKVFLDRSGPPVHRLPISSMEEFPSGQRGQTVNLLSKTSKVRILLPPPVNNLKVSMLDISSVLNKNLIN